VTLFESRVSLAGPAYVAVMRAALTRSGVSALPEQVRRLPG
jgi:hypothetical protein